MKKNIRIVVFFSLVIALGLSACSLSLAQDVTPPPGYQAPVYEEPELLTGAFPSEVPNLENGASLYQEKCLPCHGDTGLGDGPESTGLPVDVAQIGAANLSDLASPLEWFTIVLQGNIEQFMPPFSASLSEQDVWDVLGYVYSFSTPEAVVEQGALIYEENCAACHGDAASGPVAPGAFDFRNLEQLVTFSTDDFVQKVATGNGNPEHVFSTVLDAEQQKAVAYYLRSLALPFDGQPTGEVADQPEEAPEEEPAAEEVAPTEEVAEGSPEESFAGSEEGVSDGLGQVTGIVVNGSGGDLPESLEVTLEVYQSFEIVYTDTIPANPDGSFVFENVTLDPDLIYITLVELDGTFFPSNFHMGNETLGETIDLPVTIYDLTSDTSSLSASRLHVFFQFIDENTVQVIHQVSISNFGDLMVAPEQESEPVLNFSLPEGATNLVFQSGSLGNPYVQTSVGFADPSPIMPGSNIYEGLFAYELTYDKQLDWVLPVDLPTDVAVIFIQGEDVKVESATLIPSGTEALDQDVYQVLVANGLTGGQEIDLKISSGFGGFGNFNLDGNTLTIFLGVIGLGLAGFGAWSFFRSRSDYDDDYEEETADDLIDEIAALDDAFIAGEIDELHYRSQRASLKAELKDLLDEEK